MSVIEKLSVNLIPSLQTEEDIVQVLCSPAAYNTMKDLLFKQGFKCVSLMKGNGTATVYEQGKDPYDVEGPYAELNRILDMKPLVEQENQGDD